MRALLVALAAALTLAGWTYTRLANEREAHANTRAAHAHQLQKISEQVQAATDATRVFIEKRQAEMAAADAKSTKEISNALAENSRLRAGRPSVTVCVRNPAATDNAAGGAGVPGTAAAAGLDVAAAPGPADPRPAARDLWDLREALIKETAALQFLQERAASPATP